MEATSTPRVSGPFLDNYVGRNVMVVGKVVQLRGDQAIIDADGNVTAHLNRVSSSLASNFFLYNDTKGRQKGGLPCG